LGDLPKFEKSDRKQDVYATDLGKLDKIICHEHAPCRPEVLQAERIRLEMANGQFASGGGL
jgi:hypothetical protein